MIMESQKLLSLTRKCIDLYRLIDDGDHVAVGVSAGKDSLSLLVTLSRLQKFYPHPFKLSAITVDLGIGNMDLEPVKELCAKLEVPYHIVKTDIAEVLFNIREESNPCALCAKLRKGALNDKAKEIGANKIAYAHHKDDLIETSIMALIYEGRYYTFSPKTYLDRTGLTVIRPFILVDEADIIGYARAQGLPVCKNPCPMDGVTKREYVKNLLKQIYRENPGAEKRLFRAVVDGNLPGWPERQEDERHKL